MSLTDPSFIRQLESLFLLARRVLGGSLQADRKSNRKGTGITFADYSEYNLGDDFRAIDWQVFAKSDELFIKLFEMEEDATIYLLLDCSHSMQSKLIEASQLAAAIGYIGLNCHDRVVPYLMADKLQPLVDPARGRGATLPFLRALDDIETFGDDTHLLKCVKEFRARHTKKGIVLVISDFLYPDGFDEGLRMLQGMKHDAFCIQIHDPKDLECELKGDVELECVETGKKNKVTVTKKEAKAYEQVMADWNEALRKACLKRGIGHISTKSDEDYARTVTNIIRSGGIAG